MKIVPLSQGKVALVDDDDYARVSVYKWCVSTSGYAVTNLKSRKQLIMHRFIMNVLADKEVDHRDFDRLNNQKINLSIVTRRQNNCNRRPYVNNKSGFKGVSWHKSAWRAAITVEGKSIHLGSFKNIVEAAKAYNGAALKFHGGHARLNQL